jgi:hypothetical protein
VHDPSDTEDLGLVPKRSSLAVRIGLEEDEIHYLCGNVEALQIMPIQAFWDLFQSSIFVYYNSAV